jgi:hypothetical protein
MAMSKKDFIALAEALMRIEPPEHGELLEFTSHRYRLEGMHEQHLRVIAALADFCKSQNSAFMRQLSRMHSQRVTA